MGKIDSSTEGGYKYMTYYNFGPRVVDDDDDDFGGDDVDVDEE